MERNENSVSGKLNDISQILNESQKTNLNSLPLQQTKDKIEFKTSNKNGNFFNHDAFF